MAVGTRVQVTKNYRLFARCDDNRPLNLAKHKKLFESMKKNGFYPFCPVVAFRDPKGRLVVKDGQHRLAIAESLGLPVYWIEAAVDFDVAELNNTAKTWVIRDYAQMYATQGRKDYQEVIEFAEANRLPLGVSFALMAGTTSFQNVLDNFADGSFRVKDRKWAGAVASVYGPLAELAPPLKNVRTIEACMAACRVAAFDPARLVHNAKKCREKLIPYGTRDACLDMLEQVYNFKRQHASLLALKLLATAAMRERNIVTKKAQKARSA